MPRGPRLALDNAIYHVMNRGNAKQIVFHDEQDFETFLSIAAHYKEKFGFRMYHFCLMPNHFHFLWEVDRAITLSKAMHAITLTYTRYYHAKYGTVGYLWQGRFKNMLIEKDTYLLSCGAYIERNPKRAGLVSSPEEWRWSSYRFYAFGEPWQIPFTERNGSTKKKRPVSLIDVSPFYEEFGSSEGERRRAYQELSIEMDGTEAHIAYGFNERRIIGGPNFKSVLQMRGIKTDPGKRGRPRKIKDSN